ncbi:MAG: TRAP transporter small permease [Deltaproteobacteria bacterium]|nr:TRAP transporter small permease [Deltaproteobacteria bacterium]
MLLKHISDKIERFGHLLSHVTNYAGTFFLFLLMSLVVVHVVGRYFFDMPVPGAVELIEFLMIFVVFLGFGYCAAQRANVSIDLFVDRLPEKTRAIIDTVTCFFSIGIVSMIAWQGVVQTKSLWISGHESGVLHIPHFPFMILVVIGCAIFDLILIANFFEFLSRALKNNESS